MPPEVCRDSLDYITTVAMAQPLGMGGTQLVSSTPPDALRRRGDPPFAPVGVVGRPTSLAMRSVSPP
jgi:hypothetical protein